MASVIWWIRRDLRIEDNTALQLALLRSRVILPVFILDPHFSSERYLKRWNFLLEGISTLDDTLQNYGNKLVIRQGDPLEELTRLRDETGAESIIAEADVSPYARLRDQRVADCLPLELVPGLSVHPPQAVTKPDGTPYIKFTPYMNRWKCEPLPANNGTDFTKLKRVVPNGPFGMDQPAFQPVTGFPAGQKEAERRLSQFIQGAIFNYAKNRDCVDSSGTSLLSPYIHFGMLSARQAVRAAYQVLVTRADPDSMRGIKTWIDELIWRDFFLSIIANYPWVARMAFKPAFRTISWLDNSHDFETWKTGLTGYPIVDAAMRQLAELGWIHNRARMIAASFLVKDLLINWQEGESWFMDRLIDADISANNGGWQWTAGVGTDAAPYFRIFNPVLQGMKFDPEGKYIKQWLPELGKTPSRYIHAPWKMPLDVQESVGVKIGRDYPPPMVDHRFARERALMAYSCKS